jgi:hypothetical protein
VVRVWAILPCAEPSTESIRNLGHRDDRLAVGESVAEDRLSVAADRASLIFWSMSVAFSASPPNAEYRGSHRALRVANGCSTAQALQRTLGRRGQSTALDRT